MVDSLLDGCRQVLLDVAADIHGSLVYLDAGAAEVAELTLGAAFFWGLGALNVCSLEQVHPDDALLPMLSLGGQPVQSVTVFTTQLLPATHQQLLQLLMAHPHVRRCRLFCSVSELAHAQLSSELCDLGVEAYREYVGEFRQALASSRAAAGLPMPREDVLQLSVQHLPLHVTALDSQTFVLPAASAAASKAVIAGRPAGLCPPDALAGDEGDEGALGASGGLSLLSHALADLSRVLGARLEPYAVGPTATLVAKELATLPQAGQRGILAAGQADASSDSPRAGAGGGSGGSCGSIGLVLVDRPLDLATPCMHGEHVLDLVFGGLQDVAPGAAGGRLGPPAPGSVQLRPVELRLDVPHLAPLSPLPPPPPVTPPPTDPPRPGGATHHTHRHDTGASSTADRSSDDVPAAQDGPSPAAADTPADTGAAPSSSSSSDAAAAAAGSSGRLPALWQGDMGLGLFHPGDRRWLGWLVSLWPKGHKDVLLLLRKWLKEALRAEKITPARSRLTAVVSSAELRSLAAHLMTQPEVFVRHQAIIGLALAAAAAIDTEAPAGAPAPPAAVWQRLCGYEQQLLLALPEGGSGREMLLALLLEVVAAAHPDKRRLPLSGVLQLLLVTYSLSGDRTPAAPPLYSSDEADVRGALADVIWAHASAAQAAVAEAGVEQQQPDAVAALAQLHSELHCLPHIQRLMLQAVQARALSADPGGVRGALEGCLQEVWGRLRWAAATRGKLRDVRRLMEVAPDTGTVSSTNPLVRQVLYKILMQADNRDLKQVESASLVAGLLTKGLGRLGLGGIAAPTRRTRIEDHATVLLFVVGGISAAEVRAVRQELEQQLYGHKPTVLLGGTVLLSPGEAARLAFS